MSDKTVNTNQAIALVSMFMLGASLILSGNGIAEQDSWIALLLSLCMSIPVFLVYTRIINLYPGKDLYDIVIALFGNLIGKAFVILYILYSLYMGAWVLRSFTDFFCSVVMPQTPSLPILVLMGLLSVYAMRSGFETLGKCALLLLTFMLILAFLTTVLAVKDMNFSNLLPIGTQGIRTIAQNAFELFSFPFAESVLFICIASSLSPEANPCKAYFIGLFITGTVFLTMTLSNISVLGLPIISSLYYPSYAVMQIVSLGDSITRIESSISTIFIVGGFVRVTICLFSVSKGLTKLFGFDHYLQMVFPTYLITIAIAMITFDSAMGFYEDNFVYPYYTLPFTIFLPIVILIAAELKHRKKMFANQAY